MMTDLVESRRKVLDIERLPAMPYVAVRLLDALADDRTTAAQLEEIIQSDQALASKVLSLANSAYYGFAQKVTTIQRAVVAIGLRDLRLLSLGASLSSIFDPSKMAAEFDGEGLWTHCLSVSLTAREMAVLVGYPHPGELLVAGLLHDLGKLVVAVYLKKEAEVMSRLLREGLAYNEAEKRLGLDHMTTGYWLAQKWGLPRMHVTAIQQHHSPKSGDPYYQTTSLVALSDYLIKKMGLGAVHQADELNIPALSTQVGLKPGQMAELSERLKEEIPPIIEAWQHIM